MNNSLNHAYNIADLRDIARRRLPKGIFEYIDRGAEDEAALRNNRAAIERIKFKPRSLVDVSARSQDITLFGKQQAMPIAIAPTGTAGLLWHEGEIELARAAAAAGIPFTLASASLTAMEKVAERVGGRLWFQLYVRQDRALSLQMVERAQKAGYEALVVTVDSVASPNREYNHRNGFSVPIRLNRRNASDVLLHPSWMMGVLGRYLCTTGLPRFENYPSGLNNTITAPMVGKRMKVSDSFARNDLRELRKLWPRTLMVKGILHPEDAKLATDCGADAIVVSNHGGRMLDSSIAPIDALPDIVSAVGDRTTVIVDSGFRRGADIVKALALGAQAVLIGRATLYGTAAGGETGASRALALLRDEIDRVLALLGCTRLDALNTSYLALPEARS